MHGYLTLAQFTTYFRDEYDEYALVVASVAILITMILALIRAMLGPTVFDRVLALNMFGTKTVLLICVVVFLTDPPRPDFLDLALLYSLMNFIGMVALLRFSEYGSFRREGTNAGSNANQ